VKAFIDMLVNGWMIGPHWSIFDQKARIHPKLPSSMLAMVGEPIGVGRSKRFAKTVSISGWT
jgi:hypothetical protein